MDIKFYYVRGISVVDTPRFSNINAQENYFANKLVKTITNSFYPPHYTNKIRIEDTDLDFNSQVNYVSLNFLNKEYYYFIDKTVYINENLVDIYLIMDTAQTYMFNIDFINSSMDRLSIKRWKQNNINRDYVRENMSEEQFSVKEYSKISRDFNCYLIETSEVIGSTGLLNSGKGTTIEAPKYLITPFCYYLLFLPVNKDDKVNMITTDGQTTETHSNYGVNEITLLSELASNPNVLNITLMNSFCFDITVNETYDEDLHINIISLTMNSAQLSFMTYSLGIDDIYMLRMRITNLNFKTDFNYTFEFIKNTAINNPLDIKYCPQLLDENYIQFIYGERLGFTSYPLHKLKSLSFKCESLYDFGEQNRVYRITNNDYASNNDEHFTTIQNKTTENYWLVNDYWKNYKSQNQATLTTGVRLARETAFYKSFKQAGISSLGLVGDEDGEISSLKKVGSVGGLITSATDVLFKNYDITQRLKINRKNLDYTPDTEKQGNSLTTDLYSDAISIMYRREDVKDIENCYIKLERFGYKVNIDVSSENIFNYFNYRYYYNFIKTTDLELSINILNSKDIINNIKDRFNNGLRLWNVENPNVVLGEYIYDNVEIENL